MYGFSISRRYGSDGSHTRRARTHKLKWALESLEQRVPLTLSHTVAPFAHAADSLTSQRVAPYNRHAEIAVASLSGEQQTDPAAGKRQHSPLVLSELPPAFPVAQFTPPTLPSIINRHPT